MKQFSYLFLLVFNFIMVSYTYSQTELNTDSINFEQQRQRVNALLEERSKRFGDYDSSLQKKTGIFGIFKTKGDMQRSNDILQQIVHTDNNIFLETKKLLDIKDFESDKNQQLATEYDRQVSAYMKTITKLQQENDKLRTKIGELDNQEHTGSLYTYLLIAVIISLLVVIYRLYFRSVRKI